MKLCQEGDLKVGVKRVPEGTQFASGAGGTSLSCKQCYRAGKAGELHRSCAIRAGTCPVGFSAKCPVLSSEGGTAEAPCFVAP